MIRIDPHTQWTRHRIRLVGRLRCYRFTNHYSNQLYHHYNFYTDTEFQWVWLAFVTFPFLTWVRYPLHRRSILWAPQQTPHDHNTAAAALSTTLERRLAEYGWERTLAFAPPHVHIPICLFLERIGEKFDGFDLVVRTAFPLTSHLTNLTAPSSPRWSQ